MQRVDGVTCVNASSQVQDYAPDAWNMNGHGLLRKPEALISLQQAQNVDILFDLIY